MPDAVPPRRCQVRAELPSRLEVSFELPPAASAGQWWLFLAPAAESIKIESGNDDLSPGKGVTGVPAMRGRDG